jgi:hypothetical protein
VGELAKYDEDIRAQARELRDALLEQVTDKTDPRYLELMAKIKAREVDLQDSATGTTPTRSSQRS